MLEMICAEIRNFFTYDSDKHIGDFTIEDGNIAPPFDFKTDYIRIIGSRKNDGVYKVSEMSLVDEGKFHGAIWEMSIPKAFLDLAKEISDWQEKYGGVDSVAMSPFNSESFGGYSYSKSSGRSITSNESSVPTWQSIYASRLNVFRKI